MGDPQNHSPNLGKLRISRYFVVYKTRKSAILPQHAIAKELGAQFSSAARLSMTALLNYVGGHMHISCLWCQKSNKIGKQAGQSKSRPVDSALIMMSGDIFCLVSCKWDQDSTVCIPRFHGEYNLFEACSLVNSTVSLVHFEFPRLLMLNSSLIPNLLFNPSLGPIISTDEPLRDFKSGAFMFIRASADLRCKFQAVASSVLKHGCDQMGGRSSKPWS